MAPIVSILLGVASQVGAPIIKGVLEKHVGGKAGEIGGKVVDAIAAKAGVKPDEILTLPRAEVEAAVKAAEPETAELLLAEAEGQRLANELMTAEMNKDSAFGWLWRPAGMWLMLICIGWYVFGISILSAIVGVAIAPPVDFGAFSQIFVAYSALYMGGNTAIRMLKK